MRFTPLQSNALRLQPVRLMVESVRDFRDYWLTCPHGQVHVFLRVTESTPPDHAIIRAMLRRHAELYVDCRCLWPFWAQYGPEFRVGPSFAGSIGLN